MRARAVGAALACTALVAACSDDEGSAEELCLAVREDPTIATAFEDFDPSDVDDALEDLRAARVTLGELRDAAPSEVRDELSTEIDYVQALVDGLEALGSDDPAEALVVVREVTEAHPDVDEAAASLATFAERSCR